VYLLDCRFPSHILLYALPRKMTFTNVWYGVVWINIKTEANRSIVRKVTKSKIHGLWIVSNTHPGKFNMLILKKTLQPI